MRVTIGHGKCTHCHTWSHTLACIGSQADCRRYLTDARDALTEARFRSLLRVVDTWLAEDDESIRQDYRVPMDHLLRGIDQGSLLAGLTAFLSNLGMVVPAGRRLSDVDWVQDLLPAPVKAVHAESSETSVGSSMTEENGSGARVGAAGNATSAVAPRVMGGKNALPALPEGQSLLRLGVETFSHSTVSDTPIDTGIVFMAHDPDDTSRPEHADVSREHVQPGEEVPRSLDSPTGSLPHLTARSNAETGEEDLNEERTGDGTDTDGEPSAKKRKS